MYEALDHHEINYKNAMNVDNILTILTYLLNDELSENRVQFDEEMHGRLVE